MNEVTYPQMKRIFALSKEHGLDHEDLYEIIYQVSGKDSLKCLTKTEGIRVIDRLEGKQVQVNDGRITPKQKAMVEVLSKELGWHDNPKRLRGFIKKYAKTDDIKWLTVRQASNLIEGLKRQVKSYQKTKEGV